MVTISQYKKVESLEEAYTLNLKRKNKIIGGMLWLKMGNGSIQTAIDLSGLGLDTIEEDEEEFRIGCMVTLRQLETHEGLSAYTGGAMREAMRHIVGVQFRNLATVGGSIFGRYGFSDVLTMFLAMDSYVELYKGGRIPLTEFSQMPYERDVLVRIIVKKERARFFYTSVRNSRTDFPVLACAAARVTSENGGEYRFCYGARPGRAVRIGDENGLLTASEAAANGEPAAEPDAKTAAESDATAAVTAQVPADCRQAFAEYAKAKVRTEGNMRGSAAYRTHLVGVLTERALEALTSGEETEC